MATTLKSQLVYLDVAAGGTAALPHGLNLDGATFRPDHLEFENPAFGYVSSTETDVVVINNGAAPGSCRVLCEVWYTYERAFGDGSSNLPDRPFISAGTSGSIVVTAPARYALPEQWARQSVPAGATDVCAALVSVDFDDIPVLRSGSLVGLLTRLTAPVTAGTLTVFAVVNGAPVPLSVVHTATLNPMGGQATILPGVAPLVSRDLVGVSFATDGGFTPNTTHLTIWAQVADS